MKSILSFILALIMCFGASEGMISGVAQAVSQKETPIAKIANDDYVPYNYSNKTNAANNAENEEELIDSVTKQVESVGGYVETYDSEDDYIKAQNRTATAASYEMDESAELVKQVITVMTTATGSKQNGNYVESKPIANAIVRIDGLPRYTDRNGQIRATLQKDNYVELYVEKEGYNPYIEIIDITGEDKIVYLKEPSDDIDVYAAMLYYNGKTSNLMEQEFYINIDVEDTYYAELTVHSNIEIEESYFLVNGNQEYYIKGNCFYNITFEDYDVNDSFSIYVVYQGIKSKTIDLMLCIDAVSEELENEIEDDATGELVLGNDSVGLFSGFSFDLKQIANIAKQFKGGDSSKLPELSCNYNFYTGKLTVTVGFEIEHFSEIEDTKDKERYNEAKQQIKDLKEQQKQTNQELKQLNSELANVQQEYESAKKDLDSNDERLKLYESMLQNKQKQIDKLNNENSAVSDYLMTQSNNLGTIIEKQQQKLDKKSNAVRDLLNEVNNGTTKIADLEKKLASISGLKKEARKKYNQSTKGVAINFEFLGVFEYNLKKDEVENLSFNITGSVEVQVNGTFMAWVIPMFYEVKGGIEINVSTQLYNEKVGAISLEDLLTYILLKVAIKFRAELGVGLNDFLGISLFAEGKGGFSLYPFAEGEQKITIGNQVSYVTLPYIVNPLSWGWFFEWKVGVRVEVLIFDWEIGYEGEYEYDPRLPNYVEPRGNEAQSQVSNNSSTPMPLMSRSRGISGYNFEFNNVYQNSKPKLVQLNDRNLLVWVEDSPLRDDCNRTILKYSVYENGFWSEPHSVYDDGRADFFPDVYVDGNDLYITWQKGTRLFTETDDYISMGKEFDIYFAKYDIESDSFKNISNVTSNSTADFAPKFALKEKTSDALTIVWQKNSDNNIIGISGTNKIYYSNYINGKWTTAVQIYQTAKYISFVTSSYKNGELVTVCLENQTGDYSNYEDYNLKAIIRKGEIIISDVGCCAKNPQFIINNGTAQLFFYCDNKVVFTEDFTNIYTFASMEENIVNENFKVLATDTGYVFFYNKISETVAQSFCSIYDSLNAEWTYDIMLTNETFDTSDVVGLLTNDGKILSVYNVRDDESNTFINFTEVELSTDFSIDYAFYNTDAIDGDLITLTIGISNCGNVNLNDFSIYAFGQIIEVKSKILVGQYEFVSADFIFTKSGEVETIKVISNGLEKNYDLQVEFSDVSIEGKVYINSGEQIFDLFLSNNQDRNELVNLYVYINGELSSSESFMLNDNFVLEMKFTFDNLDKGDKLYFEIIVNGTDRCYSDNSILLTSLINTHIQEDLYNPYNSLLNTCKRFI